MAAETVLFDPVTPPMEIITVPVPSRGYVSFRAERVQVSLWGQALAVLLYSGPLATEQREFNDGRYCLITVPRNPANEILFLQREVWPALNSPFISTGGFKDLEVEEVLEAEDPRIERLEENLLRAAWYNVLNDLGLAGAGAGQRGQSQLDSARRRFQEKVISEAERNGFLHESQHALDEAYRVYPERFQSPVDDLATAELRAHLASIAHSDTPHYALFYAVRQYRQRLDPYLDAVGEMFTAFAGEVLHGASGAYGGLQLKKNIMVQIPRLAARDLRRLAAAVMERRFEEDDRRAGYELDYSSHQPVASGLHIGSLRGGIEPADIPPLSSTKQGGALASWRIREQQVEASGVHVYFSGHGVRAARAETYGLAMSAGGYMAVHVRPPGSPGPWRLTLTGGLFSEGETSGGTLPLEILAGDGLALQVEPVPGGGVFQALIPASALADGLLRLVLRRVSDAGPPAFLIGLQVTSSAD